MTVRMGERYVDGAGALTQAGYSALRGTETDVAALDARVDTLETATSFVRPQPSVAAASQTEIPFTGIPAWVNRITVLPSALSTNGTSPVLIQLGDSGGYEVTGYDAVNLSTAGGALAHGTSTAGFLLAPQAATDTFTGAIVIHRADGNKWVASGHVKRNASAMGFVDGDKTLSGTLDRLRLTMANGTDTFDAGSVSITWE